MKNHDDDDNSKHSVSDMWGFSYPGARLILHRTELS